MSWQHLERTLVLKRWELTGEGEDAGATWAEVPVHVTVEVEWDKLLRILGDRALKNKSRTTRALWGYFVVKAERVKTKPTEKKPNAVR